MRISDADIDKLVYSVALWLMKRDGDGEKDPHKMIYTGWPTPEPWGELWQKWEDAAKELVDMVCDKRADVTEMLSEIEDLRIDNKEREEDYQKLGRDFADLSDEANRMRADIEHLRDYIGGNIFMSDYRNVTEMREEIDRLKRQNSAYATLTKSQEMQLSFCREKSDEFMASVAAIDSERAANAKLTQEVERLTGERAVMVGRLRDALELIFFVHGRDVEEAAKIDELENRIQAVLDVAATTQP